MGGGGGDGGYDYEGHGIHVIKGLCMCIGVVLYNCYMYMYHCLTCSMCCN